LLPGDDLTITFTYVYDVLHRADTAARSAEWFYLDQAGSISFNRSVVLISIFDDGARHETIFLAAGEVLPIYGHQHLSLRYGVFPVTNHPTATERTHNISFHSVDDSTADSSLMLSDWLPNRVSYHEVVGITPIAGSITSPPAVDATTTPPAVAVRVLRFVIDNPIFTDDGVPFILEAAPFIAHDRTMVPLRVIVEALGATNLEFYYGHITFELEGEYFEMTIGQPLPNNLGTPVIVADRTFVPLYYIMQGIGATAYWDAPVRAAYIFIDVAL